MFLAISWRRTAQHAPHTRDPAWDAQVLTNHVVSAAARDAAPRARRVFDHDRLTAHDPMGDVELGWDALLGARGARTDGWFAVRPTRLGQRTRPSRFRGWQ